MDLKVAATLTAAMIGAGASILGAWWSDTRARAALESQRQAEEAAATFAQRQFEAETVVVLLDRAYTALLEGSERDSTTACFYMLVLAEVEQRHFSEPQIVTGFLRSLAQAEAIPPGCSTRVLDVASVEVVRAPAVPDAQSVPEPEPQPAPQPAAVPAVSADRVEGMPPGYPDSFGQWHAVVASFSPAKCAAAKARVREFAQLLAGTEAAGHPIYIARSAAVNCNAVTVDAGDSEADASAIRDAIRAVSVRASDRMTGSDAFVARDRVWAVDPRCNLAVTVAAE
jgi:hypothetical protein